MRLGFIKEMVASLKVPDATSMGDDDDPTLHHEQSGFSFALYENELESQNCNRRDVAKPASRLNLSR